MRPSRVDIDDRKDDLTELFEGDPALAQLFWEKLDLSWVFHENALEGVVITPEEMAAALGPKPSTVSEVSKANFLALIRRQKEANDLAKDEARSPRGKTSLALIKKLFETLTGGEGKGQFEYRRDMPLHRTYFHDIGQPARIVPELTKLVEWTTSAEFHNLHPLQQASLFHHRFMSVFPFTDLSGKVGRLIMNIMVMRAGYLPAVIHGIDRQRYYESLKLQPRTLQTVITEAIEHATDHGFKLFADNRGTTSDRSRAG